MPPMRAHGETRSLEIAAQFDHKISPLCEMGSAVRRARFLHRTPDDLIGLTIFTPGHVV
jgi:hypothetical protein